MTFNLIRPGTFKMGDPTNQEGVNSFREVEITKPFYMGRYEVTREMWKAVLDYLPDRASIYYFLNRYNLSPSHPIQYVSWSDIQQFLSKLKFAPIDVSNLHTFAVYQEVYKLFLWEFF